MYISLVNLWLIVSDKVADVYLQVKNTEVSMLSVLYVIVALVCVNIVSSLSVKREKKQMDTDNHRSRRLQVRNRIRDEYVDILYRLHFTEKFLSRKEFDREMKRLQDELGFNITWKLSWHPKAIQAEVKGVKDAIKRRLANKTHTPVKLPDETKPVNGGRVGKVVIHSKSATA